LLDTAPSGGRKRHGSSNAPSVQQGHEIFQSPVGKQIIKPCTVMFQKFSRCWGRLTHYSAALIGSVRRSWRSADHQTTPTGCPPNEPTNLPRYFDFCADVTADEAKEPRHR
jgi:hypothetical protein